MLFVSAQKFCAPEFLIGKQIILRGVTARKRQPLHVIRHPDVVGRWKIQAGMSGGSGNNRGKMRRKFLRSCPLIEPGVRPASHCHFAVAKWLCGKPLDHVVSIARLICKRLKVAAGISTTADIHKRERVSVRREVGAADVVRIGNVRSEREDHRCLLRRAIRSFRQI